MKVNQHEQLFTELTAEFEATAIQELDNETAAAIGGGYNIQFYDNNNFTELLGSWNDGGKPTLISNDKISSIIVTDGSWRLYADANYKGAAHTYDNHSGPNHDGRVVLPSDLNNKVSSFIRVG